MLHQWIHCFKNHRILGGLVVTLLVMLCFVFSGWPAHLIHQHDALEDFAPNYVVVLMGDRHGGQRASKAFEYYQRLATPPVFLLVEKQSSAFVEAGVLPPSHVVHGDYLQYLGVVGEHLQLVPCGATSTLEEARCVARYLATQQPPIRLLIVTTWAHTARAKWLFGQYFTSDQIRVVGTDFPQHAWWSEESSMLYVFEEWLKSIYWRVRFLFYNAENSLFFN